MARVTKLRVKDKSYTCSIKYLYYKVSVPQLLLHVSCFAELVSDLNNFTHLSTGSGPLSPMYNLKAVKRM